MKTIHELMLKDTEQERVLHEYEPKNPKEAIAFLDALDHVVKEWNEAMDSFEVEGQDEVAERIFSDLIMCRMLFFDLDNGLEMPFTDAMKTLSELKQSMLGMAKSYARTPSLGHWYLSLPIKVQSHYNIMRREARGNLKSS